MSDPSAPVRERACGGSGKTDRKTAAAGGKAERRGEAKKPQSRWAWGGASRKKAESKITPGTIIPTEEAPPERIPVSGKEDDHEDSDHNRCFFRDGTGDLSRETSGSCCGQPLDEVWVIARRKERLEALRKESGLPLRVLEGDLLKETVFEQLEDLLRENMCGKSVCWSECGRIWEKRTDG